jgi:hypothetical protein
MIILSLGNFKNCILHSGSKQGINLNENINLIYRASLPPPPAKITLLPFSFIFDQNPAAISLYLQSKPNHHGNQAWQRYHCLVGS